MNRKDMRRRLGALEETPPEECSYRDLEDQFEHILDQLRFFRQFHPHGDVRYEATDRELLLLGVLSARVCLPNGVGEHRFPSGVRVSWVDEGDGTQSVSASGYVRLEDLPERVRKHFKRMDPADQPERERRLPQLWRGRGA